MGKGKTTKMLQRALELAGDGPVVIICHHRSVKYLKKRAWDLIYQWPEDGEDRYLNLKFISSEEKLRGTPKKAILADHQWVSDMMWIRQVMRDIKKYE